MTHPDDEVATTAEDAALEARLRQALEASTARPSAAAREAILSHARGLAAAPVHRARGWRVPLGAALAATLAIAVVWPLVPVRAPQPAIAVPTDAARPAGAFEEPVPPAGDAVVPAAEVAPTVASDGASVSRLAALAVPPPASPPSPSPSPMPEATPASGRVDASARFVPAADPPGLRPAEPVPAPAGVALPAAAAAGAAARAPARDLAADRAPEVLARHAERVALPATIELACQPLAARSAGDGRPGGAMHLRIEAAAGRYSRDGGRTWQPLVEAAGARYVLSRRVLAGGGTAVEALDLASLTWEEVVDGASGPAVASRAVCAEVADR